MSPLNKYRKYLAPLGWLYRMAVALRNNLYDWGFLKSTCYDVPVVSIGNITVGGTGKTPHTEYLIRLLQKSYKIAVVSRGYKRKTKNLIIATPQSKAAEVGDEPLQIKRKFPEVTVAVDANRRRAIKYLTEELPPDERPNLILLDDAFQHRRVLPALSILLVDSTRPIYEDTLLPAGNLREPAHAKTRANIVIVTKCSTLLRPIDYRIITEHLNLYPYQTLFFTTPKYGSLRPVFNDADQPSIPLQVIESFDDVLLVTGIATPGYLQAKMNKLAKRLTAISFPDHHSFSDRELKHIEDKFNRLSGEKKLIVVTEKDAMRLTDHADLSETLKENLYYIPIEIFFIKDREALFEKKVIDHINNLRGDKILM